MAVESYELVVSGTLAGQFVQNIFHVNVNNTTDLNPYLMAETILDAMDVTAGFVERWLDCLPESYVITSLRARKILATGGPTAIRLAGALTATTGTRTGAISSAQVNPVVVWITNIRPNKPGRTFMPGVSESDIDAMVYSSGLLTALDNFISTMAAPFTVGSVPDDASFGIYRRSLSASDDIYAGRVSPTVGTQRRRLHPV